MLLQVLVDSDDEEAGSSPAQTASENCQSRRHQRTAAEPWQENRRTVPVKECDGVSVSGSGKRDGTNPACSSQTATRRELATRSVQEGSAEQGLRQGPHGSLGLSQTADQVSEESACSHANLAPQTCKGESLCRRDATSISSAAGSSSGQAHGSRGCTLGETGNRFEGTETVEQTGVSANAHRQTEVFGVQKRHRNAHAGTGDREEQPKTKNSRIHNCGS